MSRTAAPAAPLESIPAINEWLNAGMQRVEFLRQAQAYQAALHQWLRDNNPRGAGEQIRLFTDAHDRIYQALFEFMHREWERERGEPAPPIALLAIGGYGHHALCLKSDVDIMILMQDAGEKTEAFLRGFVLTLVDLKIDMSYSTRTPADCEQKVGEDMESVTSMTSARMLAGSAELFDRFKARFTKALQAKARRWYLPVLLEEWKSRRLKYESTVYLLQPNLKEGQGGLRDQDAVRWMLYGLTCSTDLDQLRELLGFEEESIAEFRGAVAKIQTIRNEVHIASATGGDMLMFEFMPTVAARLGYGADELRSAEEVFMADYYRNARIVDRFSTRAVRLLFEREKGVVSGLVGTMRRRRIDKHLLAQDEILFLDPKYENYFEEDHTRIMDLFFRAARWGFRLSDRMLDRLSRLAPSLDNAFRTDPANHRAFMGILSQQKLVSQTLLDMHESRILDSYMPEFERIRHMVRIDHYHHYTVDEHTLKAIEMAENLRNQPAERRTAAGRAAAQIKRWDLLNLALLLHDIGKGFGRGHALRGGQIAQRVGERMGMPEPDIEIVRFLVLSHLKMNHVAQRRDVSDPEVTRQLAGEIGDLELLKMLYVLTVCDLQAVSPDAWSEWKGQLLEECHRRTAELLGEQRPTDRTQQLEREAVRDTVLKLMPLGDLRMATANALREERRRELEAFLREVSDYYLATMPPETIARHCIMRRELDAENPIVWQLSNYPRVPKFSQLTVYAEDVPGLFSFICAALAAKGINIWSAQIFSTDDGYAINQFFVTDLENRPLAADLNIDRLRRDLVQVMKGKLDVEQMMERHGTRQARRARPRAVHPTKVIFDNDSSHGYTIVEIRTADRPGLLYRITRAMSACQLDIHRSIIGTEAYGVVDVFYVTDMDFNKIHTESEQERIRTALIEAAEAE